MGTMMLIQFDYLNSHNLYWPLFFTYLPTARPSPAARQRARAGRAPSRLRQRLQRHTARAAWGGHYSAHSTTPNPACVGRAQGNQEGS